MKLNTPGFCLTGLLIMIEMPWVMKGLVKSITFSLDDVMVKGAMAMSASWRTTDREKSLRILSRDEVNVKALVAISASWRTKIGIYSKDFRLIQGKDGDMSFLMDKEYG